MSRSIPPGAWRLARVVAGTIGCLAPPAGAGAQHEHDLPDSTRRYTVGAMAVVLHSRVEPGALGTTVSEGYVTQPMLTATARAAGSRVVAHATLNAERWTLERGEINPGAYGEGYADRRHPHTWLHEAMLGVRGQAGLLGWSVFGGKGFVPFGTDDPMVRPFVKYPANHHHSQVLERAVVVTAVRARGLGIEAGRFNGDEPESPADWPNLDRGLDSWAVRASWALRAGVEASASRANVRSPEFARGGGLDQRKEAASLRWYRDAGRWRYALVEYARTREYSNGTPVFDFSTLLAEGVLHVAGLDAAGRIERTTRPEEERTTSFYRTVRPLHDFNIIGRTRWTSVTVAVSTRGWGRRGLEGRPFAEVGYHVPRATRHPTPLDPVEVFGDDHIWALSLGVRIQAGQMGRRFGRYGVADS